ncbi:ParD-like antitoxin of type II ParDE toxin-antitoxin system [Paraperlucidibaca baekdonensis]|uniref:ParD-like antitoxin of type II ParDE toxin-antitoxin system n=1 Tax=Paraperlucidibaca baekdonensis TaxID=748120 RepID=A0A3E0H7T4_9GAMM|nr:hypothetical protein [Paraperlucidibaca baekdonensis]REH38876.1 ParD-like antitoxin of type II ParDE toxin-antitoxin system [Paraperlucidibaca baekdonensis]
MSTPVKLDNALVESARIYGQAVHRSTPKQIEHWATVGRIAEANPEYSYACIVSLLRSKAEAAAGELTPYTFDDDVTR